MAEIPATAARRKRSDTWPIAGIGFTCDPCRVYTADSRYIDLLKRCLTRELFIDQELEDVVGWPAGGPLGHPEEVWPILHRAGLRIVQPLANADARRTGEDWPRGAETMVGTARLNNVETLVTKALRSNVPGDLVETGVWRGGVVILMRALLDALGDTDRSVWACDSFEGLPPANLEEYPMEVGHVFDDGLRDQLAVSVEEVRANFERYELLDDRTKFLVGWFRDTLPTAPIEQIAVLRLDGDLYESTMDALVHLEPKVSPGGFVIVDDYKSWEPCRQAVSDYRTANDITAPIHEVDWSGVWWQKADAAV